MSNYGFFTKDKQNKIAINAKYPTFGFDMAHKPRAFKTFRVRDNKTSPIHSGDVSVPSVPTTTTGTWQQRSSIDSGTVRELVKKVKHGYNFRPVGYAVISGTWNASANVEITQNQVNATYGGDYGGDYTVTTTKTLQSDEILIPNMSGKLYASFTTVYVAPPMVTLHQSDFSGTIFPFDAFKTIICGYGTYGSIYGADPISHPEFQGLPPAIEVEIDDEYIYIYRTYWWSDELRRAAFVGGDHNIYDDVRERVKIATQYTGSVYDITVFLCPFPLDDLLTKAKTHIDPSTVAIWDVDNWDGGKVWG